MARPIVRAEIILPKKKMVDTMKLKRNIDAALKRVSTMVAGDFNKTTATWSHKPKFAKKGPVWRSKARQILVSTKHAQYAWVSLGTKSHRIPKSGKTLLRWKSGYKQKTTPRVIGSRGGGRTGPWRHSKGHKVKGIKAREFQSEIAKRRRTAMANFCLAAVHNSIWR